MRASKTAGVDNSGAAAATEQRNADSDQQEDSRDSSPPLEGARLSRESQTAGQRKHKRGRSLQRESKKPKRKGSADILNLTRGNKAKAICEIQETRPQLQPLADSHIFVTDEIVTPVPPAGSDCSMLSSFALGRLAPSKANIKAISLAVRNGGGVLMDHITAEALAFVRNHVHLNTDAALCGEYGTPLD